MEPTNVETKSESACCKPTCCAPEAATTKEADEIRDVVREGYGAIARGGGGCCGAPSSSHLGYSEEDLKAVPEGADLGLGCGNPTSLAQLEPGQRVLDLGCGAAFDALLAARAVGGSGRVIGVDMTPDMLARARKNVVSAGFEKTVDIREGTIENLPVADESVDVILSNCVINLSPDKPEVFREAFRVLAPGGKLAVSDILLTKALPEAVVQNMSAWLGCLAGATLESDYLGAIRDAGFVDVEFTRVPAASLLQVAVESNAIPDLGLDPKDVDLASLADTVFSYSITARKRT